MALILDTPLVIPAVDEKSFDKIWITNLFIQSGTDASRPVVAVIEIAPYSSATGEIKHDSKQSILIDDVLTEASDNPILEQTVQSIYTAVDYFCRAKGIFGLSLPANS